MNKLVLLAGFAVVAISKVMIIKSILVDLPVYQSCLSGVASVSQACGIDPLIYFILGWLVSAGGFVVLVIGLRMPATKSISR